MRQAANRQKQNRRRWRNGAIGILVGALVLVAGGFGANYYWRVRPVQQATDRVQAQLKAATKKTDGVVVKQKLAGGQAIFRLPKGQSVQPALKAAAEAQLKTIPQGSANKAVIVTVKLTSAPLSLATMHTSIERLYTQKATVHHTASQSGAAQTVVRATGKIATVAALADNDVDRRAINYVAKQLLVTGKHVSTTRLAEVMQMPLLAQMTATNFALSSKGLTITEAGKAVVTIPLKAIERYLKGAAAPTLPSGKVIALTFDDGPNARTTPQVLKTLAEQHVKATFFMVGTGIAEDPTLAKQVKAAGHEVGTHSYDHPYLPGLSLSAALDETYGKNLATYYSAFDALPPFLRPPFGAISKTLASHIDMPAIQWNIDSEDWRSKSAPAVIARVNAGARPGSIVLMHDIQPATVTALPTVIANLKKQGYRFVTVSELLGNELLPGEQYFGQGDHRPV